MKIAHVLLTTDLSDEALRAFEPALELARQLGARVTVLNVIPDLRVIGHGTPMAPMMSLPDPAREMAAVRAILAEQCERIEGLAVEVAVVCSESPARGVVDYAKQHGVDLIALSTHGRTGFRRLALGSVAEDVLRMSTVPVLSFHRPG